MDRIYFSHNNAHRAVLTRSSDSQRWNASTEAFEAHADGNWSDYLITPTQLGTSTTYYYEMPDVSAGNYALEIYDGSSPSVGDQTIGGDSFYWTGDDVVFGQAALADSEKVPFMLSSQFIRTASADKWRVMFVVNGKQIESPTNPRLDVYKDDGTLLFENETLTKAGKFKHNLDITEAAKRASAGEIMEVVGKATGPNGTDILFSNIRPRA